MRGLARSAALLAALAVAAQVPARARQASDQTQLLPDTEVEVRVWSVWPGQLNKGWVPLNVEFVNRGDRRRRVRLEASCYDWQLQRRLEQSLALEPGQRAELEVVVPAGGQYPQSWSVSVGVDGRETTYFNNVASGGGLPLYQNVLAAGPADVASSEVKRWIEDTSTTSLNGSAYVPPGGSASVNDDVQIEFATFGELPKNAIAYSSLDLVVVDARAELPAEERLEPLMAWARGGGEVLFVGGSALERLRERGAVAPWLEARFERSGDARYFVCGMGRIAVFPDDGWFEAEPLRKAVRELARVEEDVAPRSSRPSRTSLSRPLIPGLGAIPHRIFALLLLGFAVVIGPVNFVWVRRRKRPVLLLVTIPSIALVASLALLSYGIFFQGLEVKTASNSVAFLDGRLHRSACVESRLLFAGLAPSDGLRPEPGTAVHVVHSQGPLAAPTRERLQLDIVRESGLLLRSDYLPTRIAVAQVLCTERAARARLDIERAGAAYAVTNNLGAAIERLLVRDHAGSFFLLEGRLDPGARAALVPAAEADVARQKERLREPFLLSSEFNERDDDGALPPACYAAQLASAPFRDDCGIEVSEKAGHHALFGVWGLDEEAWR